MLVCFVVWSCSKDNMFENKSGNEELTGKASFSSQLVIKVYPGEDDTKSLLDAFASAKAAGRGSIIKLMPGEFKFGGMIEVREFYGTLMGSGREKTIITYLRDIDYHTATSLNKLPAIITFIGGNVTVSDLTMKHNLSYWMRVQEFSMLLFSGYSADFQPEERKITANIRNAGFIGLDHYPELEQSYESAYAIYCGPDMFPGAALPYVSNCDLSISNCIFSKLTESIKINACTGKCRIGTEGRNIFHGGQAVFFNANYGLEARVENNEFQSSTNGYCLWIVNEYIYPEIDRFPNPKYQLRNNIFDLKEGRAIVVYDTWRKYGPSISCWVNLLCDNNTFNFKGNSEVLAGMCLKNALFTKNRIIGDSGNVCYIRLFGMEYVPITDLFSEGCKFLNNNFLNTHGIYDLSSLTRNNLIQADPDYVSVEDSGINNKIIWKSAFH